LFLKAQGNLTLGFPGKLFLPFLGLGVFGFKRVGGLIKESKVITERGIGRIGLLLGFLYPLRFFIGGKVIEGRTKRRPVLNFFLIHFQVDLNFFKRIGEDPF